MRNRIERWFGILKAKLKTFYNPFPPHPSQLFLIRCFLSNMMSLKDSDAIIRDGSQCYDNVRSYRCLWHKMKSFFKSRRIHQRGEVTTLDYIITRASNLHHRRARACRVVEGEALNLIDQLTGEFITPLTVLSLPGWLSDCS